MKGRLVRTCMGCALSFTLWSMLATVVSAQQMGDPSRISADTNNAVIEGRVTLPSGRSIDSNVRIILKNSQNALTTIYTNKHGEFQFINLSQGTYFVHAEVDDGRFEPVVEKINLGRGITWEVTLQFRESVSLMAMRLGVRVISAAEASQAVPEAAKKQYNLGLKLVNKGDIVKAATYFQEALAIYPEYLAARNDLGAQYLKLNRVHEAEEHFLIVLERDLKNFNARFNLGLVWFERRDFVTAIAHFTQAITIDSSRPTARLWLGVAMLEMGDLPNAERELTRALITGGSECTAAHYHLARAYLARGDVAESLRSLEAYLQDSPRGEHAKEAKLLADKLRSKSKREAKQ